MHCQFDFSETAFSKSFWYYVTIKRLVLLLLIRLLLGFCLVLILDKILILDWLWLFFVFNWLNVCFTDKKGFFHCLESLRFLHLFYLLVFFSSQCKINFLLKLYSFFIFCNRKFIIVINISLIPVFGKIKMYLLNYWNWKFIIIYF